MAGSKIRNFTLAALSAALLQPAISTLSWADTIYATVDRAKVLRVARAASTVIVGNPSIADATIQDSRTLIITGVSFGSTNLIVLDQNSEPIADEVIVVRPAEETLVTVFRGASRATVSCTPTCAPTITVGDSDGYFSTVTDQQEKVRELATDDNNR